MPTTTENSLGGILKGQVIKLSSLRLEASSSPYLQEYYLKSIFNILLQEYEVSNIDLQLELHDLKKLAELCIEVIDCKGPCDLKIWSRWVLFALKILILVARKPLPNSDEENLRHLIYNSLVKNLKVSKDNNDPFELDWELTKAGLSAYCIAQFDIGKILTQKDAEDLIVHSVMPLAIRCFREESIHKECTLQDFLDDFHGLNKCHDEVFFKDSFHKYPLVIRLLIALERFSDSSFNLSMICKLIDERDGKIYAEDIVILNACQNLDQSDHQTKEKFMKIVMTTRGFHQAHMAFLIWHHERKFLGRAHMRPTFAKYLLDNLVTGNNKLLDEVAIRYFMDERWWFDEFEKLLDGQEIGLISKLVANDASLDIYNMFLRNFKDISESQKIQFEDLTRKLISEAIRNLDHLKYGILTKCDIQAQSEISLSCLGHFIRLRNHRLDADHEVELNQALLRLAKAECLDCSYLRDGILLTAANSLKVHPDAWQLLLILVRNVLPSLDNFPADFSISPPRLNVILFGIDIVSIINTINKTLPHFLITDSNYFYNEIASLEVLDLIYEYCEHSICSFKVLQLDTVEIVLKAILITWPETYEKTKLDSGEHRMMLEKFITLLVSYLVETRENNRTMARKYPDIREEDKVAELLFAFVAALSKHRYSLNCVMSKYILDDILDDQAWLENNIKSWISLVVNDERQPSPGPNHYYGLVFKTSWAPPFRLEKLDNVVIAYEGYKALCGTREFREPSEPMIDAISKALNRGARRAPVNSIESRMYETMKAGLMSHSTSAK